MAEGFAMGEMRLPRHKDLFLVKHFSYKVSVAAGSTKNITRANLQYEVPEGYKPFSILQFQTGNNIHGVAKIDLTEETNIAMVRNFSGDTAYTTAFNLYVTFIKTEYADGFWFDGIPMIYSSVTLSCDSIPLTTTVSGVAYSLQSTSFPVQTNEVNRTTSALYAVWLIGEPLSQIAILNNQITATYAHNTDIIEIPYTISTIDGETPSSYPYYLSFPSKGESVTVNVAIAT